jgi:hypothetical protein
MRFGFSLYVSFGGKVDSTPTLHDHPAEVRVQETLADAVGILGGVGITMMGTTGQVSYGASTRVETY